MSKCHIVWSHTNNKPIQWKDLCGSAEGVFTGLEFLKIIKPLKQRRDFDLKYYAVKSLHQNGWQIGLGIWH